MTREEAIKQLSHCEAERYCSHFKQKYHCYGENNGKCNKREALDMAIEALQDRPTGKWVDNGIPDSILSKCSNCGYTAGAFSMNYCPSCGARMKEENNENSTL